jgi:hypothetical protein
MHWLIRKRNKKILKFNITDIKETTQTFTDFIIEIAKIIISSINRIKKKNRVPR